MNKSIDVKVKDLVINNNSQFTLIAGPCVIESKDHALRTAEELSKICSSLGLQFIYKSSFDKANRTSLNSSRGPGIMESLEIFSSIKETIGCPVITDIHEKEQIPIIAKVIDIIQIPAFLCRQTDLLIAAAKTNLPIMVKKGQFLAPWDMKNVVDKIDHRNLNLDVDFMKDQLASTENLAIAIWNILMPLIQEGGATLHSIKLYETENNFVEYLG